MEESQNMAKFLNKGKVSLNEDEKKIQKTRIKSACKKAIQKNLSSADVNNNLSDSNSSS